MATGTRVGVQPLHHALSGPVNVRESAALHLAASSVCGRLQAAPVRVSVCGRVTSLQVSCGAVQEAAAATGIDLRFARILFWG